MSFQIRRRFRNRSLLYNPTISKLENFGSSSTSTIYVPPLTPAAGPVVIPVGTATPFVGTTGDWKFEEFLEMNGPSLLQLMYRNQQIHTFLP